VTGPRKILVAGYYGAKNAGDEAILAGLLACFRAAGFAGDFTVITRDPADTRALHGVEGVAWNDIEAVIDAAQQADLDRPVGDRQQLAGPHPARTIAWSGRRRYGGR